MSLRKSVRQLRSRQFNNISHVKKIQTLVEEKETNPEFIEVKFIPQGNENATKRTSIYESAVVLSALSNGKITSSTYNRISKSNEFSPYVKEWVNKTVGDEYFDLLLEYWSNLGNPITKLGKFQDFIHDKINENYYRVSPKTFQHKTKSKENTADIVLIVDGSAKELKNILTEISKLSERDQVARATTLPNGKVTVTDENGKEISFFQVSLKKGEGAARIGKVGTLIRLTPDPVKQIKETVWSEDDLVLLEFNLLGRMKDLVSYFKNVATKGIKVFTKWAQGLFAKVVSNIQNMAQKGINKRLNDKGMKAANDIIREFGNKDLVESFVTVDKNLKPKVNALLNVVKSININHDANVKLVTKLNDRPKMKTRNVPPILFLNPNAGRYNETEATNQVKDILSDIQKTGKVSRDKFKFAVTLASNNAGNIAINEILKGVEKNISNYDNLVESLFAFVSTLEGEAKFGNTALPLVICYGGLDGKVNNMGTRDDYTKTNASELLQKGKELNDFYVVVIDISKPSGKMYNIVNVHLCTGFKDDNGLPKPMYQTMVIANSSGSKFASKIEVDKITPQSRVNSWK